MNVVIFYKRMGVSEAASLVISSTCLALAALGVVLMGEVVVDGCCCGAGPLWLLVMPSVDLCCCCWLLVEDSLPKMSWRT